MANIVIVSYKAKPGKAEALEQLMRVHLTVLKQEGLVTERPSVMVEAEDGTIVKFLNECRTKRFNKRIKTRKR